ncbi:hypothetical protein T11_14038, partial [Trichinella zimbabwensis]
LSLDPSRPGKNLKNDFLEFLENSQPFRLSLDPSSCPWTPAGPGEI